MRSRSNSELTNGRSRSRSDAYRHDPERSMGESAIAASHLDYSPVLAQQITPRASPDVVQKQFENAGRLRSNSRSAAVSNYFDAKSAQPLVPSNKSALSPNTFGASNHGRPSPGPSPMLQSPTPPISGANTPVAPNFASHPAVAPRPGPLRKKTISKSEISVPTLISATSNIDTVDLPEGASLQNGMDEVPVLPPINPRRRAARKLLGMVRGESASAIDDKHNYGRSKTPDPWMSRAPESDFPFDLARNGRSFTERPSPRFAKQSFENNSSPAIPYVGDSPERVERARVPRAPIPMDGGMF